MNDRTLMVLSLAAVTAGAVMIVAACGLGVMLLLGA